jgi:hypothetical protein
VAKFSLVSDKLKHCNEGVKIVLVRVPFARALSHVYTQVGTHIHRERGGGERESE